MPVLRKWPFRLIAFLLLESEWQERQLTFLLSGLTHCQFFLHLSITSLLGKFPGMS
jgi:hypothetical protein